jgi:hypothetical protein
MMIFKGFGKKEHGVDGLQLFHPDQYIIKVLPIK